MAIWSDATITRFLSEAEESVARETKCIIKRVALVIVSGTPVYTLPDDLISIRRVTWKGKQIHPVPHLKYIEQNHTSASSTPLWYIFNQQGRNSLRFYPIPDTAITGTAADLFGASIRTKVIVEYYALPSCTETIPVYIRRRILKSYAVSKCFMQEGNGQNYGAAQHYSRIYNLYTGDFKSIYVDHFVAKINVLGGGRGSRGVNPPPILPYTFGESGEF